MDKTKDEGSIIKSIQLTAKLQKSLRKLLSQKKRTHDKSGREQDSDRMQMYKQLQMIREQREQLLRDNQFLSKELMRSKQEIRELKKQILGHRKYIKFMQGYNCDLKKEMVFWMRKPNKLDIHEEGKIDFGKLMTEVVQLRELNQNKERELLQLKKTFQVNSEKDDDLFLNDKLNIKTKAKHSLSAKIQVENACTSCNYTNKFKKSQDITHKRSSTNRRQKSELCDCHRRYIQTSQFRC